MTARRQRQGAREYWRGMARGAGGAILFSLPMLMTMELWWLGFYADRLRLALFVGLSLPLLVGLSRYSGLRPTHGLVGDLTDAFSAVGIGLLTSLGTLLLFGVLDAGDAPREVVGKVALEAVPAAIGAVLAQSQMGQSPSGEEKEQGRPEIGYWGQLFLMGGGALYLSLSVAPTQEMVLIAYKMNAWQGLGLATASILLLHAFVYALEFRGQEPTRPGEPGWKLLLRFSLAGYAIALLLSAYVLWTFGRFAGNNLAWSIMECVVLGFPAAVGAAAARLII